MNRVFWVRHGENRANLTMEFSYKQVDYPLTARGILQAEQTANFFASQSIDAIYSSPLLRARGTAEIIAARLAKQVTTVEEFREINVGSLEGTAPSVENWEKHDQIVTRWTEGRQDAAFPGGESGFELSSRIQAGLRKVLADRHEQNIVIVAHGGCILFSLVDLLPGQDIRIPLQNGLCNGGIAEFNMELKGGQIKAELLSWGREDHLTGFARNVFTLFPLPADVRTQNSIPAAGGWKGSAHSI